MADVAVNGSGNCYHPSVHPMDQEVVCKSAGISHGMSGTNKHKPGELKFFTNSFSCLSLLFTPKTVDSSSKEVISSEIPVSSELRSTELCILLFNDTVDAVEETKEFDILPLRLES